MSVLIKLAFKSIRYRKATLILSLISVSLSVVLLLGVERLRSTIEESFTSSISGTDLIVGARSGNVPLLLSSIFHIGYPSQNVSWETYEYFSTRQDVKWSIPISIGDSHKGFSVVGTTEQFFEHYEYGGKLNLQVNRGEACVHGYECVLGAKAAKDLGYTVGDNMVVTHGMGHDEFVRHEDEPFKVAGILETTGTPVDQSIFVSIYTLDAIHSHFYSNSHDVFNDLDRMHNHAGHAHHHETQLQNPKALSSFLLGVKSKSSLLSLQRTINEYTNEPLTAIMPVITLLELWEIVKPIEQTLIIISILVLIIAMAGVFTTIMISLSDRIREISILRSAGAKSQHIFGLILLESFGIICLGIITGISLLYAGLYLFKPILTKQLGVLISIGWFSLNEIFLLMLLLLLGGIIGLIPAYKSYKNSMAVSLVVKK
ncbi:ABC transporter permease [Carboxylicivirga mesophila]|uniref:ABC transporter permease n=2 Tax=Carboxylicivirga TaxID=1628153 RepID=A0A941IWU7_9BACT|nr:MULTISPECIES: ABC transporter permease [Carboxylicivirga]MBR8536086.1 ABC transporter permease [Carboxylicivirga sediminis]MBS2210764.1 ABC transporter permease [Carboxylicivirga mesophila]